MNSFFDFFPLILFFTAYRLYGIYIATATAIAASLLQVSYYWYKHRRLEIMQLLLLVFITLLGGATLAFHNDIFIKWKPTVMGWVFASVFLVSQFLSDKPLTQRMLEKNNVELPENIWKKLNLSWVFYFLLLGTLNLFVAYHFDTHTWVNFKVFGILGSTLLFTIVQSMYVARFVEVKKKRLT